MAYGIYRSAALLIAMCGPIDEQADSKLTQENKGRPTLGGTQFWTDHLVCHGWRIQRNVQFGQYRLLKPTNRVAAGGTFAECRQAFDLVRTQPDFPPIPSTVVVTLHGLGRTRNSMSAIGKYAAENGEFGWINFGYASTRGELGDHALALRQVLDELAALKHEQDAKSEATNDYQAGIRFHFIAHSLGNIVIRNMLSQVERGDAAERPVAWQVGRMVMLGPPNQGSAMANLLKRSTTFRVIAGSVGKKLGAEWDQLRERLVTPQFEFAVIAGGKGDDKGYNPLLDGDDDLVVRVEETKLAGAADFAVIRSLHTVLMNRKEAKEMALRFLQNGCLTSADERQPIP